MIYISIGGNSTMLNLNGKWIQTLETGIIISRTGKVLNTIDFAEVLQISGEEESRTVLKL